MAIEDILDVSPEQFLIDNEMIATVPSHVYSTLEDGTVKFENEDVEELILRLRKERNSQISNNENEIEEIEEESDTCLCIRNNLNMVVVVVMLL